MSARDLYADVTAQVVRQIEAGAGNWKMPWQAIAEAGEPVNASTNKAYRGGNHLVLGMVGAVNGWSGRWATYKQWQALGAQVRKGRALDPWREVGHRSRTKRPAIPASCPSPSRCSPLSR